METLSYEKILQDLEQFLQVCSSIELRETKGRVAQYRRAIAALIKAIKTDSPYPFKPRPLGRGTLCWGSNGA